MENKISGTTSKKKTKDNQKDTCLNNINLSLRHAQTHQLPQHPHQQQRHRSQRTYSKKTHKGLQVQGSLENVSSNPLGGDTDFLPSTLRRSRSLAISRENIFDSFEIPAASKSRRQQLIPRAKLIEKPSVQGSRFHSIPKEEKHQSSRRRSLTSSEYAVPQTLPQKSHRNSSPASYHSLYSPDSLQWNAAQKFRPKPSSHKPSNYTQEYPGISLPNYYPDSICETDLSLTDLSNLERSPSVERFQKESDDNVSSINLYRHESSTPESLEGINYNSNVTFEKSDSYLLPRVCSMRQYTPHSYESKIYREDNSTTHNSLIVENSSSSCDGYETVKKKPDKQERKSEEPEELDESDRNFDEINLNNENIVKRDTTKHFVESNPIYKDNQGVEVEEKAATLVESNPIYNPETENPINLVESRLQEELPSYEKSLKRTKAEDKTSVISILEEKGCRVNKTEAKPKQAEETTRDITTVEVKDATSVGEPEHIYSEPKPHSHHYLKDFIESQKGSKKPLEHFLSRKNSRSSFQEKKPEEENHYYSLPDSTSKHLRQCEKIDRKLRKCERVPDLSQSQSNRFIVNIGQHFDVTAESNIPVDFEVKISKIPKLRKSPRNSVRSKRTEEKHQQQIFLNAVKNLNNTLRDENQNITKPQVIDFTRKTEPKPIIREVSTKRLTHQKYKKLKDNLRQEAKEKLKVKPLPKIKEDTETTTINMDPTKTQENLKEYQQKLDSMRSYWTKISVVESEAKPKQEAHDNPKSALIKVKEHEASVTNRKLPKESDWKPNNEPTTYFKKPFYSPPEHNFESLNPNVEIIEKEENERSSGTSTEDIADLIEKLDTDKNGHKIVCKAESSCGSGEEQEFDHVRYRVVKSDLFQKNIFAKYYKESQFEGLMQYLQQYSFQELLIDNNIVIIEPIRSCIPHEPQNRAKTRNITNLLHKPSPPTVSSNDQEACARRRFFYHPVRINKEINEDELPNPDTVKQVREMFEGQLLMKKARSTQELQSCKENRRVLLCKSSNNPGASPRAPCCENQLVSEDVLQKIRECGTSVTYYGGKVLSKNEDSDMTKAIMNEIKTEQNRNCSHCSKNPKGSSKELYQGMKFKLLKSNSCSSRLQLVGHENPTNYQQKFLDSQKRILEKRKSEKNLTNMLKQIEQNDANNNSQEDSQRPVERKIGSRQKMNDKKMTQWGNSSSDNAYSSITFSSKPRRNSYHNYDKVEEGSKKREQEMEFETYEVKD